MKVDYNRLDSRPPLVHTDRMKFGRIIALTVILMTLGVARAHAEEAQMNALQTALSSTTVSGNVDTSVEWTLGRKDFPNQTHAVQNAPGGWWVSFRYWLRVRFGVSF